MDEVTSRAPHRRSWAVASEIARLAFVIFGNALCALIFGALAFAAFGRSGLAILPLTFAVLTIVPLIFGALASRGLVVAIGERGTGDAANGSPR